MSDTIIGEYYSDDKVKKAVVKHAANGQYIVDFYESSKYSFSVLYPDRTLNYVEDAAETYVQGLFNRMVPRSEM